MSPLRHRLRPLTVAVVLAALAGCDFSDDDGPIIGDSDVVYVDFSFDDDDYVLNGDGLIASFESDNLSDSGERRAIEDALAGAMEGALVLLYADGSLLYGASGEGTWAALPVTQAYEAVGSDGVPYVDYTVTYSYSFDDSDLYFDATSSAQLDWSTAFPSRLDFRLVTAPAYAFARAGSRVDVRDYEAVRQALALPE